MYNFSRPTGEEHPAYGVVLGMALLIVAAIIFNQPIVREDWLLPSIRHGIAYTLGSIGLLASVISALDWADHAR